MADVHRPVKEIRNGVLDTGPRSTGRKLVAGVLAGMVSSKQYSVAGFNIQRSPVVVMATEATVTVPSDQFPLGTVFTQIPGASVELERLIPSKDVVIPYFWIRGTHVENIEEAFSEHPGVKRIQLVDSVENEYLLRVEWSPEYDDVLSVLVEADIPLIKATGTDEQWTFDIRGDTRSDIATFHSRCQEMGIPVTLTELHELTPVETVTEEALTQKQQEALLVAYDCGYFESPREATMEEIGEQLGISQQAVASRLRHGLRHILKHTLSETGRLRH